MNEQRNLRYGVVALVCVLILAQAGQADVIARFADPAPGGLPGGGGETMFLLGLYGARLYGGWSGPPRITLESPAGTFPDCTMWLPPMHVDPDGRVWGGQMVFYYHNQIEVLRIGFTDGHVDSQGFGAGPQTGGTVVFVFTVGGVQPPPGIAQPPQSGSFYFAFHNVQQTPSGPAYTASFSVAAQGTKGDLNCDGVVNFADINAFVLALTDPIGYANVAPWCAVENADMNGDGRVDFADINPFVARLGR